MCVSQEKNLRLISCVCIPVFSWKSVVVKLELSELDREVLILTDFHICEVS